MLDKPLTKWEEVQRQAMKERIIRWLIEKYLPGWHLSRNPVRKKEVRENGE